MSGRARTTITHLSMKTAGTIVVDKREISAPQSNCRIEVSDDTRPVH
jgi:hypothetical protein